jgi:hypothetical protein
MFFVLINFFLTTVSKKNKKNDWYISIHRGNGYSGYGGGDGGVCVVRRKKKQKMSGEKK